MLRTRKRLFSKRKISPTRSQTEAVEEKANTEAIDKIQMGSNKICIREDLAKKNMMFSPESFQAIMDMGNVELMELKESRVQCPSCLYNVFEGTVVVLTVVDETCFFFNFDTATNVWFDGLRGIPLRAGVPCSKIPSKRPAVANQRYREAGRRKHGTTVTSTHTAEGPPQARQAAAYPIRCSFHLLPILVYRKVPSKRPAVAKNCDNARQAAASTERP